MPKKAGEKNMNKQQEKLYKEYLDECEDNNENPISKEDFVKELEAQEAQEKEDYLNYQKRVGMNNHSLPEGSEPEKILSKEEWIKAGKPTGETKHEKFIRLAEKRTEKALAVIDTLFNLKSGAYESSESEKKQIVQALSDKVKSLEEHYAGKGKTKTGFKFSEQV